MKYATCFGILIIIGHEYWKHERRKLLCTGHN